MNKGTKGLNNYKIVFYFSDKINFSTECDSDLDIDNFTKYFNNRIHECKKFISFIGDRQKLTINLDNVLLYTIEEIN